MTGSRTFYTRSVPRVERSGLSLTWNLRSRSMMTSAQFRPRSRVDCLKRAGSYWLAASRDPYSPTHGPPPLSSIPSGLLGLGQKFPPSASTLSRTLPLLYTRWSSSSMLSAMSGTSPATYLFMVCFFFFLSFSLRSTVAP